MIYLGSRSAGRDNNLNLIRMLAATAVLVSHAFPIAWGPGAPEPLLGLTGYTLGTLAVMVFFAVSGFLITASFERTSSRTSFVLARGLRLFPGLAVCLVFVAFVLGPLVTSLPVAEYLTRPEPYAFVLRDLALFPLVYTLPGVFEDQPLSGVVGSIWTLRHEVLCYAGVFVAGILGLWATRTRAALALGAYGAVWSALAVLDPALHPLLDGFVSLSLPFAVGVAFHVWRDRIPLSLVAVAGTFGLAWASAGTWIYPVAVSLAVTYGTFWLAYVPGGVLRHYNRVGDYSYGIYIYAFPIQGAAVWAFGDQSPVMNMVLALPVTLALSILSWHLVEDPAMRAKDTILTWLAARGPVRPAGHDRAPRVAPDTDPPPAQGLHDPAAPAPPRQPPRD